VIALEVVAETLGVGEQPLGGAGEDRGEGVLVWGEGALEAGFADAVEEMEGVEEVAPCGFGGARGFGGGDRRPEVGLLEGALEEERAQVLERGAVFGAGEVAERGLAEGRELFPGWVRRCGGRGPTVLELLADVSAVQAASYPIAGAHSIWELVLHLRSDYEVVLRRLAGEGRVLTPESGLCVRHG
jgi:hypothetical protein